MPFHIKPREKNNVLQILSLDKLLNFLMEISNKINILPMNVTSLKMNHRNSIYFYSEITSL